MVYNNDNQPPSPWLKGQRGFTPAKDAGFAEYLRWMRSPLPVSDAKTSVDKSNDKENNFTKLQLLHFAAAGGNGVNYRTYFQRLNERTKKIAGEDNTFAAECPWRMRVGGETGPENILLPAFDNLGFPYIAASSLRGVARHQAWRELLEEKLKDADNEENAKQQAKKELETYFGSLEAAEEDQAGKIVFLDTYPDYKSWGKQGRGLAVDIANSIWGWQDDEPKYNPNPNSFLSLRKPKFIIGLRLTSRANQEMLDKVKSWLIRGLQAGIGSQVNSGYGEMVIKGEEVTSQPFLELKFTLQGQLIHSNQKFRNLRNPHQNGNNPTYPEPEVRPIAFKSMLRYWFRTITLGYLSPSDVQTWEANLFGGIEPPTQGLAKVRTEEKGRLRYEEQPADQDCLQQQGILKLLCSSEVSSNQEADVKKLLKNLTWLMFQLGGVGQGARRPLHKRSSNPYYRGTKLRVEGGDAFWQLPDSLDEFKIRFQERLTGFWRALACLRSQENKLPLLSVASSTAWAEAMDVNCRIIVCAGEMVNNKPKALAVLHSDTLNPNKSTEGYNIQLCGKTGDRSPVWIADLGEYQVVTVFGVENQTRFRFLKTLEEEADEYQQIFPG